MSDINVSKELVQKVAEGDRTAFEELYRETCRAVYFTCFGFLKDEQEAQDITQDVYLTVFEQLDTLEDAGKFKPWLYRMAANKSINYLKKKKPSLPGDEQLEDMETEENENFLPEEYALNADKRAMVLDITRKVCTDAQYQTILLYYFNELSVAEIAEIMECQESNVKKRMSIARAKIRDGVLQYEKKSGDKLYSLAAVPFLTALFTAQMQGMQVSLLPLNFPGTLPKPTAAVSSAKTGSRMMLKGLQLKIAVSIAVVAVVGGVTVAAVTITNQRSEEASAGVQEESMLDAAGVENTEDLEPIAETDIDVTESDEGTLQEETGTAAESETAGRAATNTEEESETAESASDKTSEQTAESEQQYTYTDMSATMYATQTVNVRDLPNTDGERVGVLSANYEIAVTGQCNETGWYRFEYDGGTAYVSNNYVSDIMLEASAPAEPASSDGGSSNNAGKEPCPYPLNKVLTETTEYGLKIYVLYTTMPGETIWVPMYSGMQIENSSVMTERDEQGVTAYGWDIFGQQDYLTESTGVFHGLHFVNPPGVKVGTYAEGTVYKFTAGGHFTNIIDPERTDDTHTVVKCPNNSVGCQPGTIN